MDTNEATEMMSARGFTFVEDADPRSEDVSGDDPDAEFQPRALTRMAWFTRILLFLVIFAAGFVVGVLVDRALWG